MKQLYNNIASCLRLVQCMVSDKMIAVQLQFTSIDYMYAQASCCCGQYCNTTLTTCFHMYSPCITWGCWFKLFCTLKNNEISIGIAFWRVIHGNSILPVCHPILDLCNPCYPYVCWVEHPSKHRNRHWFRCLWVRQLVQLLLQKYC